MNNNISPWSNGINKQSIEGLYLNDFDRTWAVPYHYPDFLNNIEHLTNLGYSFDGEYHHLTKIPVENIKPENKDWPLEYVYNSEWFRSDTFKSSHDGIHVVFSGDSNTEGVGSSIEKTWSHLLYTELKGDNNLSGYYNLGKGGNGWQKTITNFMVYVDKFGAPDYLFILQPNLLRYFEWDPDGRWRYNQKDPYSSIPRESDGYESTVEEHRQMFPLWAIAWKVFLKYCESIGTRVLWSTWDTEEDINILKIEDFNSTYFSTKAINPDYIESKRPGLKLNRDDLNVRDGHPGYLHQLNWKEHFRKEIQKKGWFVIND